MPSHHDDHRGSPPDSFDYLERKWSKTRKSELYKTKRFACPFYKNSPVEYASNIACRGPGWPQIDHLRGHLYRCHGLPSILCARCAKSFSDNDGLLAHQREEPLCVVEQSIPHHQGLEHEPYVTLISSDTFENMSGAEKWRNLYRVLFPDVAEDVMPSPYYEDHEAEGRTNMDEDKELFRPDPLIAASNDFELGDGSILPTLFDEARITQQRSRRESYTAGSAASSPAISTSLPVTSEYIPEAVSDGSDLGDGPILPATASWARTPQQQSRRGSDTSSGQASNPAISTSLPVTSGYIPEAVSDGSDLGDGPILPATANWARTPQQRSRRGSYAVSSAASSPAISCFLPVMSDSAQEPVEATTSSPEESILNTYTTNADVLRSPQSSDPKRDIQCNIPYTDSGYQSARSHIRHVMHERGTSRSDETESDETYTTREKDDSDADTSYSAAPAILPDVAERCVVDICESINKRLEESVGRRSSISLIKRLPSIIKEFAIKIGSNLPDQLDLRIMHFVHMHHQYIADQLQLDILHDEDEPLIPRETRDKMPLEDIMKLWEESRHGVSEIANPSECFEGIDNAEDVISALPEYSKRIVNSAAYEWLISSLVNEASFQWDEAQPRTMVDQIRQEILSKLPTGRISSRHPPPHYKVSFIVPSNFLAFFLEHHSTQDSSTTILNSSLPFLLGNLSIQNTSTRIADGIVATSSSAHSIQLSKLSQYMDQTWSSGRITLLSVFQDVINQRGQNRASSARDFNTNIEVVLKNDYLETCITGTSYSIAEYGEQLCWLTAALQPAIRGLTTYVRPLMRPLALDRGTSKIGNRHVWVIELETETADEADASAWAVNEWLCEPQSPVIVRGFPTLIQPEGCSGIEIPRKLPRNLLPVPMRRGKGIQFSLPATGKILQLFRHTEVVTVWHILGSPRADCVCRQRFLKDSDKDPLPRLNSADLWDHRHIITNCSTAELYYRDTETEMVFGFQSTESPRRDRSELEEPQLTPNSVNTTESSGSLDADMLSIPDSSDCGLSGIQNTDDDNSSIIKIVAPRLVSKYREETEQQNPADGFSGNTKQCNPGQQQSPANRGSSQSTPGVSASQNSSSKTSLKRSAEQDDRDSDHEDSQGQPEQKKPKGHGSGGSHLSFACPYCKQSPSEHRNCFGKYLPKICRVKQHLIRNHTSKSLCDRCLARFPDEEHKNAHLEHVTCKYESNRFGVITTEKRDQLSRRPRGGLTEWKQWYFVWDILFPGLPHPSSPYIDLALSLDLSHFREFCERQAPAVFTEVLRDEGLAAPEHMVQRAVYHAMGMLYDQWLIDRTATPHRFTSQGQPAAVPCEQQYDEQLRVEPFGSVTLSPNADSGIDLGSQSSSSRAREDVDPPLCPSAEPAPPSDGIIEMVLPGPAHQGVYAADTPRSGANPQQLSVDPPPVGTGNPKPSGQHWEDDRDPEAQNLVPEAQTFNDAFDFASYYNPNQF